MDGFDAYTGAFDGAPALSPDYSAKHGTPARRAFHIAPVPSPIAAHALSPRQSHAPALSIENYTKKDANERGVAVFPS